MFNFDEEVEPILSVLCGKTLEQARMEVLEEEELREMHNQQRHFEEVRNAELAEAQRLEAVELRRKQEIDRRKTQQKTRKQERVAAHMKYVSRVTAKNFLYHLKGHVFQDLNAQGVLPNPVQIRLHEQVVPWMYEKVLELLQDEDFIEGNVSDVLWESMKGNQESHKKIVDTEHQRIEANKKEAERQRQKKEEERRLRHEARAAKKRAEMLK